MVSRSRALSRLREATVSRRTASCRPMPPPITRYSAHLNRLDGSLYHERRVRQRAFSGIFGPSAQAAVVKRDGKDRACAKKRAVRCLLRLNKQLPACFLVRRALAFLVGNYDASTPCVVAVRYRATGRRGLTQPLPGDGRCSTVTAGSGVLDGIQ